MIKEAIEGWTFALVEEKMIEAWGFLMRMPDRERGWLASCERSSMPAIVRETRLGDQKDYDEAPRRPGLRSAEVDIVERVLTDADAWIMWVPERDRGLVAIVLRAMSARLVGGFSWGVVATWYGWGGHSDVLRKRYGRAIARIAAKLDMARAPVF